MDPVQPQQSDSDIATRLIGAADALLRREAVEAVTVEAVAAAAGVSRATAFRHLGRREDMIVAVALRRGAEYSRICREEMNVVAGAVPKIRAAFLYLVRELPRDPVFSELFAIHTAVDVDTDVHDLVAATLGPVIENGRRAGQIRTDVPIDDILSWVVEQVYLSMQQRGHSERVGQKRLTFLVSALMPLRQDHPTGETLVVVERLSAAIHDAQLAIDDLRGIGIAGSDNPGAC